MELRIINGLGELTDEILNIDPFLIESNEVDSEEEVGIQLWSTDYLDELEFGIN